jgi:hypothetical protein
MGGVGFTALGSAKGVPNQPYRRLVSNYIQKSMSRGAGPNPIVNPTVGERPRVGSLRQSQGYFV